MAIGEGSAPLALPGGMAEVSRPPNPPSEPLIDRLEGKPLSFSPGAGSKDHKKPAFHKKSKKAFA